MGSNKTKMKSTKIKKSWQTMSLRWLLRVFLYGWAVTVVFPLVWMVSTSLKSSQEFMTGNVWKWPELMFLTNFIKAWKEANMSAYALNTLFVTLFSVALYVLMLSTTSYIIGVYRFRFIRVVERFYWVSMMIPGALLLVPLYFQVSSIGDVLQNVVRFLTGNPDISFNITDNLLTLAVIYAIQALPGGIYLLVGFVRGVDKSFMEAARIDGAGEWHIFSKVVLPFVKPILLFQCLTKFMGTWNEYLTALTFLESEDKYTLSVGIQKLITQFTYQSDYGAIFAGLLISIIPILILYILFQNVIQNGTDMSEGLK